MLRERLRQAGRLPPVDVEQLPPEAWTPEAWLLAGVHDALTHLAWLFLCAHLPHEAPRPPPPQPLPRPTGMPRRRRTLTAWLTAAGATPNP